MIAMRETLRLRLAMLVESGADRFDPARFRYIESLARRALGTQDAIRRLIEQRAFEALVDFQNCFDQARAEATDILARFSLEYPDSKDRLRRFVEQGRFKELQRLVVKRQRGNHQGALAALTDQIGKGDHALDKTMTALSFDDLLRQQEEDILHSVGNSVGSDNSPRSANKAELKTFRLFKKTWTKLHSDRLVTRAVKDRPENAGPLNSQMLVTRSLFTMRHLSPNYLNRFVSYIDTLLWLEQIGDEIKPRTDKKRNRKRFS